MKTLKAFWHWVENDKPTDIRRDKLSKTAVVALCLAESQVAARAFGDGSSWSTLTIWDLCSSSDGTNPNARPEWFRPKLVKAVRDLSLAICPALEAMHAAVGEPVPAPKPDPIFKREYLADWVPASFTGRLLWRDYHEPKPIVLHPDDYAKLAAELGDPRDVYEERAHALVAVDQGIAEQKRRDFAKRLHEGQIKGLERTVPLRSDDLPDDEREYEFTLTRVGEVSAGGELCLEPRSFQTISDCDKLRGLCPRKITLLGSEKQWAIQVTAIVLRHLLQDVLAPMMAEMAYCAPSLE